MTLQLRRRDNSDVKAVTELRADGWPLCPFCENDELACLDSPPSPGSINFCYVCGGLEVVEEEP